MLKNLLLKGEDTNYGYRLMTGNQDLKHEKVQLTFIGIVESMTSSYNQLILRLKHHKIKNNFCSFAKQWKMIDFS